MRNAFAEEITALATANESVVLLSGDIGNRLFNGYKQACPTRFYNCGVAEANMTSMAAGMALCGMRPVTYTIAPFNTVRCLEQIRLDVCYHNVPVVIVGLGAGLSYSNLGATHHSMEDVSLMRSMPNMTIVCPADAMEVRLALRAALQHSGPVYLRLGKKNEPLVHDTPPAFVLGQSLPLQKGHKICLIASGTIVPEVLQAAKLLAKTVCSPSVLNMHTIKPLDTTALQQAFDEHELVVTVEEHSLIGGLGAAIAEWRCDNRIATPLLRLGGADAFLCKAGNQQQARIALGLSGAHIADAVFREFSL